MPIKMITQQRLKELLHYDPETGIFTWLNDSVKTKAGDIAGYEENGYIRIKVLYKKYQAHQLAWLYMTGAFPILDIDHKDRVRNNNVWTNLREVSKSQNSMNTGLSTKNNSGFKGVSFNKKRKKFVVSIMVNKKAVYLGSSADVLIAGQLYQNYVKENLL